MFVVKIYGGLGNQICQYIFGKYLEKKYNCDVVFDFYYFEKFNYRKPSLLKIVKNIVVLSHYDIHIKFNPTNSFKFNSFWNKVYNHALYYNERNFKNLDLYNLSRDNTYYFDGYWQKKEYFNFFTSSELDSFFLFGENHSIKNVIHIHVRRGDYLIAPNDKIFFTQDLEYYNSSIKILTQKYKLSNQNISIFIFTDDKSWAISNLKFDYNTSFISGVDHEDFLLLSCSKYLIMSNSTFSFAAAHLKNNGKVVISPSKWYKDNYRNTMYLGDMCSDSWLII